ncbi:histamine H2 receptor-like [Actinia tenebrosa]|uniref:Histamine H2 receptor-like n=1 Tax=Actinia tenebrosa TaxID=6105 RepID=A0A6P8HDN7_ACTTE|nr:histamine H2 receptor-like [Actinia tenebrosa]XP_031553163.1 histamine H2 receptor-like [Actinia tenebrosa]
MNISSNNSSFPPPEFNLAIVMVFLVLEGILVVVINALVIFLIFRNRLLRTVTNFCLGSLALSDMLTGLYVIPLIITCNYPRYNYDVCLAMDLGNRFLAISTILHLLVITMERYYTIVFSKSKSNSSLSNVASLRILFMLWVFSLAVSLVQLLWIRSENEDLKHRITIIYDLIVLGLLVFTPLILMALAYTHIFCVLRRQINKIKRSIRYISEESKLKHEWKERRALLIYAAMIVLYITGWFNYFLLSLQEDLSDNGPPSYPLWANVILLFLRLSTGIFNPILYTFLKQDFRTARKSLNICLFRKPSCSSNGYSQSEATFGFSSAVYKKDVEAIQFLNNYR